MKTGPTIRTVLVSLLTAGLAGCAAVPFPDGPNPFSGLENRVGERLRVRGHLHYKFEDHNLYPSVHETGLERCIPVSAENLDVLGPLERANHYEVVVEGIVASFETPPGTFTTHLCKDFGLLVTSIRRR
jgi:hypothetical protein